MLLHCTQCFSMAACRLYTHTHDKPTEQLQRQSVMILSLVLSLGKLNMIDSPQHVQKEKPLIEKIERSFIEQLYFRINTCVAT